MKIEVAARDVQTLRMIVESTHESIKTLPVMTKGDWRFDGTRRQCRREMQLLRKLYKQLSLALKKIHGHDCNAVELKP